MVVCMLEGVDIERKRKCSRVETLRGRIAYPRQDLDVASRFHKQMNDEKLRLDLCSTGDNRM